MALEVHQPEVALTCPESENHARPPRREAVSPKGLSVVLGGACALVVHRPEDGLRGGVALPQRLRRYHRRASTYVQPEPITLIQG